MIRRINGKRAYACSKPFGLPRSRRNPTSIAGLLTRFRLEAPSHLLLWKTVAIECLSLFLKAHSSGTVRDSHPIPF